MTEVAGMRCTEHVLVEVLLRRPRETATVLTLLSTSRSSTHRRNKLQSQTHLQVESRFQLAIVSFHILYFSSSHF